jgi:hypothetical protein
VLVKVRGGDRRVHAYQRVLLRAQVDLILVQEILAQRDLVQGIPIRYSLHAHLRQRILYFRHRCRNVCAGAQCGVKIPQRPECRATRILKQLASRDVSGDRNPRRKLYRGSICISVVGHGVRRRVQREWQRIDRRPAEQVRTLVVGISQAYGLVQESLYFAGNRLLVPSVQRSIRSFDSKAQCTRHNRYHVTQRGIGYLLAAIHSFSL